MSLPPHAPSPNLLSVLLVDDDPRNLYSLNALLEGLDARLVAATSGAEALKALLDEDFALILLDVRMPDLDGYETAALIRQRLRSAHTPIIFITGNDRTPDGMMRGYEVGAVDFIVKPIDPDVLRSKVAVFLELHRKTEEVRRQGERLREIEAREHQRQLEALAAAERRRTEEAVRDANARLGLLLSAVPVAVFSTDPPPATRPTSMSPGVERITGFPPEAFINSDLWAERLHPEDRDRVLSQLEPLIHEERSAPEYRWRCADGSYRWFQHQARLLRDARGQPTEVVGAWVDIHDRKSAEERLRVTLQSIADGVVAVDQDGRVTMMSHVAEALAGRKLEDAEGSPIDEVFIIRDERTGDRLSLAQLALRPRPAGLYGLVNLPDGMERVVHLSASPKLGSLSGAVLVIRDITDQRRRDEEVFKASKLESIGVLAGGIAHDFNNLLTGILASVSIAELRASRGKPVTDALKSARQAGERARGLTQQLLTFARGGAPVKALLDVGAVVRDAATFALQGSRSRAVVEVDPQLRGVEADAGQLAQVVQNLVLNADQAMANGGTIRLTVTNRTSPPDDDAPELPWVVITVADEGPGISADNLPRIFDPFFTTRPGGSGLGLATVYSIVQRHGGRVEAESRPGQGATFTVWLPAAEESARSVGGRDPVPTGGHGRILVMDDEESVRTAAADALDLLGYECEITCDGTSAVERYLAERDGAAPFAAVIMDLTVPGGMGGQEAIRRIREFDPSVRALVWTGYSTDPVATSPETYGFRDVVQKPWDVPTLDAALRRVLGR